MIGNIFLTSGIIKNTDKLINKLESYLPMILDFFVNVLIGIVILIAGRFLIKYLIKAINKFFTKARMEVSIQKFLISLIRALLYILLIIIVCNQIGINTTSFIAVLGSAGLAIGLAMQGSLSNFAGGILILILKPFKVNDYIIDNSSGKEGTVKKIDLFYTSLITPDNKSITIPNGTLANSAVTNVTAYDKRRLDLNISINYDADIKLVKSILTNVIEENVLILKEEKSSVFISSLGENQIIMGIRVWVNTSDYWDLNYELNEKIKEEFEKLNIQIPFRPFEKLLIKKD